MVLKNKILVVTAEEHSDFSLKIYYLPEKKGWRENLLGCIFSPLTDIL